MKYIQNNGRMAVAFSITLNNRAVKLELDRRRLYRDTGNIATAGLTEVSDEAYDELCKSKNFNRLIKAGTLEVVDEKTVKADIKASADKELIKENKKLEKEAEKAVKAKEEAEAQLSVKDKEINDLKAQLEALTKKGNKADTEKAKAKDKADADADAEADKEAQGF